MELSTSAKNSVYLIEIKEAGWNGNKDETWCTSNLLFLTRDGARQKARVLRESGEEVRIVKFTRG